MEKCTSTLLAISFFFFSSVAQAGEYEGLIDYVQAGYGYTNSNSYFVIKLKNATRTKTENCSDNDRMAIDPSTAAGKTMVSMLLSAHASQKRVQLIGDGTCGVADKFESIEWLRVF